MLLRLNFMIMIFKSKTELALHFAELQKFGYVSESWKEVQAEDGKAKFVKVFSINFDKIKTD